MGGRRGFARAHAALLHNDRKALVQGLALTVVLGLSFTALQAWEYAEAPFAFHGGGIYPSVFFLATGFHGFHVIVGTIFLAVCLLRLLAGLDQPSGGQLLAGSGSLNAVREDIRLMFQDSRLLPWKRVIDNVGLGLSGDWRPRAREALAAVCADPALASLRRRLDIAASLIARPRVLFLDEPTAALGVKQSVNVLKLVNKARERGISVIFITHNVNHAYPVGDTFTLLNRGRSLGSYAKADISKDEVLDMMAGGSEMVADVWSGGRHMVRGGRHVDREAITAAYRAAVRPLRHG